MGGLQAFPLPISATNEGLLASTFSHCALIPDSREDEIQYAGGKSDLPSPAG